MINNPPTADIWLMTSPTKNGFINVAVSVMKPWYKNTETDENNTPMPKEDAKMIEERPSRADFANKVWWFPVSPLSKDPTMAMDPTQKIRVVTTKPFANPLPAFENLFSKNLPKFSNRPSIFINSPIKLPMTKLKMTSNMSSVFKAIFKPINMTARLMACMTVTWYFFGMPPLNTRPNKLPAIIAKVLTMVPNKLHLLYSGYTILFGYGDR